ncbi:MAG: glycosyltransferase [Candidatus Andersenbacteria bacterium]
MQIEQYTAQQLRSRARHADILVEVTAHDAPDMRTESLSKDATLHLRRYAFDSTRQLDEALEVTPEQRLLVTINAAGRELLVLQGMQRLLREVREVTLLFVPIQKSHQLEPQLLSVLHQAGLELFVLDNATYQHYRLTPERLSIWQEDGKGRYGLLCLRPERAMSVVIFSQLASLTGSERSMLELVRELTTDHGALVTVVFPREGSLVTAVKKTGASTLIAPYHTWYSATPVGRETLNIWMRMSVPGVLSVLDTLRRVNPQVVLSNTRFIPWGLLAAQLLDKPHIVFPREAQELADMGEWLTGQKTANDLFYNNSHIVACNSPEPAQQFGNRPKCEIYKTHLYISKEDREQPAPNVFIRPTSFKLFFPGNIYPDKGQMDALEAVNLLVKKGRDVELVFLGAPYEPFISQLKAKIQRLGLTQHVRFAPFSNNPYPHFVQANCILVCTRGEAFGRVAAEAMVLGVPVIATNVLGLASIVTDGQTALAYTPGNYQHLAELIERLITQPHLAEQLVRNAQKQMESFTPQTYGGSVWKMLLRLKGQSALPNQGFAELAQGWITEAFGELVTTNNGVKATVAAAQSRVRTLQQDTLRLKAENQILKRDRDQLAQQLLGVAKNLERITATKTWRMRAKVLQRLQW